MVFLNGDYFTYDGWDSKLYNLILCEVGDNDNLLSNGVKYNVNTQDGINFPLYVNSTMDNQEFTISICKISQNGEPLSFDEEDLFEINRILFCNDDNGLKAFCTNGYTVMCKATNGESWKNSFKQGYINITLFALPYMTLGTVYSQKEVSNNAESTYSDNAYINNKYVTLDNKTNAFKKVGVDIDFQIAEDTYKVIFKNMNSGEEFCLDNLNIEELKNIHIYGDGLNYIESNINKNINVLNNLDTDKREWLKLVYGYNRIKITTLSKSKNGYNYFKFSYTPKICYQ